MSRAVMFPKDVEIVRSVIKQAILNAGFEVCPAEVTYLTHLEKKLGELSNDNANGIVLQDSNSYSKDGFDLMLLEALFEAGVDNWEGYQYALEIYRGKNEDGDN